jgi:hypothetical protein
MSMKIKTQYVNQNSLDIVKKNRKTRRRRKQSNMKDVTHKYLHPYLVHTK